MRRSPAELVQRARLESRAVGDRFRSAPSAGLSDSRFALIFEQVELTALWMVLASRPYPIFSGRLDPDELDSIAPGEAKRIHGAAETVMSHTVDLLGSGPVDLGAELDWHADFKNKQRWPAGFFRDIDILNQGRESDVKIPWELSRLQWAAPVAQAYQLSGDERYAEFMRDLISDWINANPYARSVNWTVTMEAAMRIFTWTWLFHVFKYSAAWEDDAFRSLFLRALHDHGVFCERYLEDHGINGNHCTADAAALVLAGEFFGGGTRTWRWREVGWSILVREIFAQVHPDGVDFEGSTSYHRMVTELFLWPVLYRREMGKGAPELYLERLRKMGRYTAAYTRRNATAPNWGDADDGRAYIFGGQAFADHSYLPALIGASMDDPIGLQPSEASQSELVWGLGPAKAGSVSQSIAAIPSSVAFPAGGVYIMRNDDDHLFIDCGPVGYAGRGGHGHNDCLSFDLRILGTDLITDSGCYVYTQSAEWRNLFRGTASHNTPMIDGAEQNRFVADDELFSLHDDAAPAVEVWQSTPDADIFIGSHSGYQRLFKPVTPRRTIVLDKTLHGLLLRDQFDGSGVHDVFIPFHLAPDVVPEEAGDGLWRLVAGQEVFIVYTPDWAGWHIERGTGWVSDRYGVKTERPKLMFDRQGELASLHVAIWPEQSLPVDKDAWIGKMAALAEKELA